MKFGIFPFYILILHYCGLDGVPARYIEEYSEAICICENLWQRGSNLYRSKN